MSLNKLFHFWLFSRKFLMDCMAAWCLLSWKINSAAYIISTPFVMLHSDLPVTHHVASLSLPLMPLRLSVSVGKRKAQPENFPAHWGVIKKSMKICPMSFSSNSFLSFFLFFPLFFFLYLFSFFFFFSSGLFSRLSLYRFIPLRSLCL